MTGYQPHPPPPHAFLMLGSESRSSPLWSARSSSSSSFANVMQGARLTLSPATDRTGSYGLENAGSSFSAGASPFASDSRVDATNDLAKLRQSTHQLEQTMGSPLTELRVLLDMPFMRGEVASPFLQTAETSSRVVEELRATESSSPRIPISMLSTERPQFPEIWEFLEKHALQHHHTSIVADLGATSLEDLQGVEDSDLDDLGFKKLEKIRFEKAVRPISEYISTVSDVANQDAAKDPFVEMEQSLFAAQRSRSDEASRTTSTASAAAVTGALSPGASATVDKAAYAVAVADKRSSQLSADVEALNAELQAMKSLTKPTTLPSDEEPRSDSDTADAGGNGSFELDAESALARMDAELTSLPMEIGNKDSPLGEQAGPCAGPYCGRGHSQF